MQAAKSIETLQMHRKVSAFAALVCNMFKFSINWSILFFVVLLFFSGDGCLGGGLRYNKPEMTAQNGRSRHRY